MMLCPKTAFQNGHNALAQIFASRNILRLPTRTSTRRSRRLYRGQAPVEKSWALERHCLLRLSRFVKPVAERSPRVNWNPVSAMDRLQHRSAEPARSFAAGLLQLAKYFLIARH